jgi:hypothetical protein
MALQKGQPTWLSYYHALSQEKGTRGEAFKTEFSLENTDCTDYTRDETKISNKTLESDKISFIILPTDTTGKINILHYCMIDETDESGKRIMGVHGTKFVSPWKTFKAGEAVRALQPPTQTRSAVVSPPSLAQFSGVTFAAEFFALTGKGDDENNELDGLKLLPNCHLLHPRLFLSCVTEPSMKTAALALKIIIEANNGYAEDDEEDEAEGFEELPALKDAQQLLTYLWALVRASGKGIALEDINPEGDTQEAGDEETLPARAHFQSLRKKKDSPPRPPNDAARSGSEGRFGGRDEGRGRRGSRSRSRETDRRNWRQGSRSADRRRERSRSDDQPRRSPVRRRENPQTGTETSTAPLSTTCWKNEK